MAGVVGISLAVLAFARVGGVRGSKTTIHITAGSARGVLEGTEVLFSGKRIGTVNTIRFLPPETDTLARLVIEAEVLRSALSLLRRDSYAEIRPSGTIIGAPVVDIAAGTSTAAALAPGDTIRALPQVAGQQFLEGFGALGSELKGTGADWRSVMANLRSMSGAFGEMRVRGTRDMDRFRAQSAALMRRVRGDGTVGLALQDRELRNRATAAIAAADSVAVLVNSDRGTLGRLRRDSTLGIEMEKTSAELAAISNALDSGDGTAGRLSADRAIANQLDELRAQLDLLIEDFKRNPFRYVTF